MQFMRSTGIDCTKYSRCSLAMVHIGRFFCVISSSRFFKSCNKFGNHVNSHEHINGLSAQKAKAKFFKRFIWFFSCVSLRCKNLQSFIPHSIVNTEHEHWTLNMNSIQNWWAKIINELKWYSPTMSTTRNVSIIGSITSSGIRDNLLFWMFNVSNELRFSNASAGSTSMLKWKRKKTGKNKGSHSKMWHWNELKWRWCPNQTYSFFCKFKNVMESPYPKNASSGMTVMLFDLKSKWRRRCNGLNDSLGIWWMLLSPRRRYCRFSRMCRWIENFPN